MKEGGWAQSCPFQGFTRCDRGLRPWPFSKTARAPPWALRPLGDIRGTAACAPDPLLPPSWGWQLWWVLFPGASPLSDETQGRTWLPSPRSQPFSYCQVPRDRCPMLTPMNAVIAQGVALGRGLPFSGSVAQTLRMAEAGILGHHQIHLHLMPEFPPQGPRILVRVCLNTSRDGESLLPTVTTTAGIY